MSDNTVASDLQQGQLIHNKTELLPGDEIQISKRPSDSDSVRVINAVVVTVQHQPEPTLSERIDRLPGVAMIIDGQLVKWTDAQLLFPFAATGDEAVVLLHRP